VVDEHVRSARRDFLRLLAAHDEAEELISIGAYVAGSNHDVDIALALKEQLLGFLQQEPSENFEYPRTCRLLIEMQGLIESLRRQLAATLPQPAGAPPSPMREKGVTS
jgi:flagellar biosynthesis/type III secretory pathway ATPase